MGALSPKARQAKNKARLARYEEMAAEAERNRKIDTAEINIPPGPRLGNVVLEAEHLSKGFGDRILIKDLSFTLPRAGIVGVIGPNGVGKTTLFKTIVGLEKADSGSLKVGETVSFSYVDQNRTGIDPEKTSGRSSPTGWTTSRSRTLRSHRARTSLVSGSRDRINRSRQGYSPVVSATV